MITVLRGCSNSEAFGIFTVIEVTGGGSFFPETIVKSAIILTFYLFKFLLVGLKVLYLVLA